jgi:hypothetical protein
MTELRSNRWPVNQLALQWLRKTPEPPDPDISYPAQLAWWGPEKVDIQRPVHPSQPEAADLEMALGGLLGVGPAEALKASRWFLSNPNLGRWEQERTLALELQEAESPQAAAVVLIQAAYSLMVASQT